MSLPLIGLTTSRTRDRSKQPQISLSESYTAAVIHAGACPVVIPHGLPEDALATLLRRLDGILFTGGGDVHPDFYHSAPHPRVAGIDTERDRLEIWLIQHAVMQRLPFLGICRGAQVINVALGGSIYEDLLDQRPGSLQHQFSPGHPRDYLAHPVQVEEQSRLASILDAPTVQVNSFHHQGLRLLAPALKPTAFAPDGLIEAFELPDHPFALAVQWHPECLPSHPCMPGLFRAFVEAASNQ